jgi:hypothetical protein
VLNQLTVDMVNDRTRGFRDTNPLKADYIYLVQVGDYCCTDSQGCVWRVFKVGRSCSPVQRVRRIARALKIDVALVHLMECEKDNGQWFDAHGMERAQGGLYEFALHYALRSYCLLAPDSREKTEFFWLPSDVIKKIRLQPSFPSFDLKWARSKFSSWARTRGDVETKAEAEVLFVDIYRAWCDWRDLYDVTGGFVGSSIVVCERCKQCGYRQEVRFKAASWTCRQCKRRYKTKRWN